MLHRKEFGWSSVFFFHGEFIHIRIVSFFKRRFLVIVVNFKKGTTFGSRVNILSSEIDVLTVEIGKGSSSNANANYMLES